MRYLFLALVLLLAAPAWAGPLDQYGYGQILSGNPTVIFKRDAIRLCYTTPSGGSVCEKIQIKRIMLDNKEHYTLPEYVPSPVEVPDMNGDGTIDEQDKRLAEYAVEDFKRKYNNISKDDDFTGWQ